MNDTDQDFETEDEDDGMIEMVNISDETITVRVSNGQRVQKVRIKPGGSNYFEEAYCLDVKGAGRQLLLPILTRQSLREDRIPRLVRRDQAEEARAFFESRTYGTSEGHESEVEELEAKLAAAKKRQELQEARRGEHRDQTPKPKAAKAKPLSGAAKKAAKKAAAKAKTAANPEDDFTPQE